MAFLCRLFGCDRTSLLVDAADAAHGWPNSAPARCAGCDESLVAGDLVMRAHLSVFHSSCFSCCVCHRRLSRGQQFAFVGAARIYCRSDYERLFTTDSDAGNLRPDDSEVGCDSESRTTDDGASTADEKPLDCNTRRSTRPTLPVHPDHGMTRHALNCKGFPDTEKWNLCRSLRYIYTKNSINACSTCGAC